MRKHPWTGSKPCIFAKCSEEEHEIENSNWSVRAAALTSIDTPIKPLFIILCIFDSDDVGLCLFLFNPFKR